MGKCQDKAIQYSIWVSAYKVKNYIYKVTGYTIKISKLCTYIISKCANCEGSHQVTAFKYLARLKTKAKAWKIKARKSEVKAK